MGLHFYMLVLSLVHKVKDEGQEGKLMGVAYFTSTVRKKALGLCCGKDGPGTVCLWVFVLSMDIKRPPFVFYLVR